MGPINEAANRLDLTRAFSFSLTLLYPTFFNSLFYSCFQIKKGSAACLKELQAKNGAGLALWFLHTNALPAP